jgi:hypothetical protein
MSFITIPPLQPMFILNVKVVHMGKILSGILGPVSGKVGGVVGGRWKNVPYIRSYVVPSDAGTDLQLAQRAKFAYLVEAAKPFVGRVFNPYYDKFLSKQSGFNRFISENFGSLVAGPRAELVRTTDGPLYPGSGLAGVEHTVSETYTLAWDTALGVDGDDDDVAIGYLRHDSSNYVTFFTDGVRSDGAMSMTYVEWGSEVVATECGVFFARVESGLVKKISRNLAVAVTPVAD